MEESFKPLVVDTREVVRELRSIASTYKLSMKSVDFNLLNVSTFYRFSPDDEWQCLEDDKKNEFDSDEFMRNVDLEIFQQFKIEIFHNLKSKDEVYLPKILLGANKTLTSVIAKVHKTPKILPAKDLEKRIIQDIKKKKIRSGILVCVREKNMRENAKKLASIIGSSGCLENDINFEVMEGLAPIPCKDNNLIFHYQKKVKQVDEQGRVDYAKRGYVLPAKKDEVIIEYIKAKVGVAGRDCRGNYMEVREPIEKDFGISNIKVSENILMKEDDDTILYIAKIDGYVFEENGLYDIRAEIDIDAVDFKTTGAIEAGLDSSVTVNIKEDDTFKDAIGAGMKVETAILNVEGNIANNATVTAKEVNIGGQTHKSSSVTAKKANIGIHKGYLKADEATIDRLEGGEVEADVVRIKSAVGGKVVAREIYVENLLSNTTLEAYMLIDIHEVKGSDNKLIINPTAQKDFNEKNDIITSKIEKLKRECRKILEQIKNKNSILARNKTAVEAIKNKILELKSSGAKPPATLVMRIKDYQALMVQHSELEKCLEKKETQKATCENELQAHWDRILDAKIVNHSTWTELNEIRFKLLRSSVDIVHSTRDGEIARELTLGKADKKDFRLKIATELT